MIKKKRVESIRAYRSIGGKFYHRLLVSLLVSSSIFALISLLIFAVVFNQVSLIEKHSNEGAYTNQLNTLNIAQLSLSQMLGSVDTFCLDSWLDDTLSENYRHYYELKLYSWLSSNSGNLSAIAYSTSLISNSFDTVITPVGTCSLEYYLNNYTNLSNVDCNSLEEMLCKKIDNITTFAVYNEDGVITDAYFAIPYFTDGGNNMVFLVRFFLSRFFNLQKNQHSFLIGPKGQIISNLENPSNCDNFEKIVQFPSNRVGELKGIDNIQYSFLANMQWAYVSCFESKNLILAYFIILTLLLASYAFLIYLLVFKQARKLYIPLSNALTEANDDIIIDKDTNEIELLRKRNEAFLALSKELRKANDEMKRYALVRTYRTLLENGNQGFKNDSTIYSVAIVRFNDTKDAKGNILAFQLTLQTKESEGIGYVPYGLNCFALILRAENTEKAKQMLLGLLHGIPQESDVTSVLSCSVVGRSELREAYKECLRLLDYASSLYTYRIITSQDIKALGAKDNFNYSIDDEVFLLKLVVSGNPQAKDELDEILSRNKDGLSYEARFNLASCLLTTLARAFSELKKTPEDVLGYTISYSSIMLENSADDLLKEVKRLFFELIESVSLGASESDSRMLSLMKSYIHENYMNDIGLQNLADKFNITPKYCGMLFSKLCNENFKNYLNRYRVEEAKKIIQNNQSIKVQDLASMVGFNSSTSFIRVFVKYIGVTPKAYADSIAFQKN